MFELNILSKLCRKRLTCPYCVAGGESVTDGKAHNYDLQDDESENNIESCKCPYCGVGVGVETDAKAHIYKLQQ